MDVKSNLKKKQLKQYKKSIRTKGKPKDYAIKLLRDKKSLENSNDLIADDDLGSDNIFAFANQNEDNQDSEQDQEPEQLEDESILKKLCNDDDNDPNNKIFELENELLRVYNDIKMERSEKEKLENRCKQLFYENKKMLMLYENYSNEKFEIKKEFDKVQAELLKSKEELDAITKEYMQIMSERDLVHKEMEALQEKLSKYEESKSRKKYEFDTSSLRYSGANFDFFDKNQNESFKEQIELLTRQRDEAIQELNAQQLTNTIREINSAYDTNSIEKSSSECKCYSSFQNENLIKNINYLTKEIETFKKKRDWALNERDKVIKERESIRALCDDLRHQRDKAISDLVESLRDTDELKKHKIMAFKQIQKLEEKVRYYEEKLILYKEIGENSKASANDNSETNDSTVLDHERIKNMRNNYRIIKVEIDLESNEDLGLDFEYAKEENQESESKNNSLRNLEKSSSHLEISGKKEFLNIEDEDDTESSQNNNYIIISNVNENSIAYGKLKTNDQLLFVNDFKFRTVEALKEFIHNQKENICFIVSRYYPDNKDKCSTIDRSDADMSNIITETSNNSLNNETKDSKQNVELEEKEKFDLNFDFENFLSKSMSHDENGEQFDIRKDGKNSNLISVCLKSFEDLLIETGIYISAIKKTNKKLDKSDTNKFNSNPITLLSPGDRIISINGVSLTNKSIYDITKMMNNCDSINIIVQKLYKLNEASQNNNYNVSLSYSPSHFSVSDRDKRSPSFAQKHLFESDSRPHMQPCNYDSREELELKEPKYKNEFNKAFMNRNFKRRNYDYFYKNMITAPLYPDSYSNNSNESFNKKANKNDSQSLINRINKKENIFSKETTINRNFDEVLRKYLEKKKKDDK